MKISLVCLIFDKCLDFSVPMKQTTFYVYNVTLEKFIRAAKQGANKSVKQDTSAVVAATSLTFHVLRLTEYHDCSVIYMNKYCLKYDKYASSK